MTAASIAAPVVVDSLRRAGADEALVDGRGNNAVRHERGMIEDIERVHDELLAKAPADRAWRRRGHVVFVVPRPPGQDAAGTSYQRHPLCRHSTENSPPCQPGKDGGYR